MQYAKTIPAALCLLLVATVATTAKEVKEEGTSYLGAAVVDVSRIVPPPPEAGSAQALAEIAELKQIVAARTSAELAEAVHDDTDESGDTFAPAVGPAFDLEKLPATKKMLQDITATEDTVSKGAKKFFHRPRPWIVIPDWKTCSPHKDGPALNSYPSGHATLTYAMGVVLSSLMPDKSQSILASSARFAESRMTCGVHFRSDLAAGQALGTVLGLDLLNSPAFQADYAAAADELVKAGLRQAK